MGLREMICLALLVACASASYYSCPTLFNFYPDASDCTKFYRCMWGKPVRFSCAPGTRWVQSALTCDHIAKVPCGQYPPVAAHAYHAAAAPYGHHAAAPYAHHVAYPAEHGYVHHNIPNAVPVDPEYFNYVKNYKYDAEYPHLAPFHKK